MADSFISIGGLMGSDRNGLVRKINTNIINIPNILAFRIAMLL